MYPSAIAPFSLCNQPRPPSMTAFPRVRAIAMKILKDLPQKFFIFFTDIFISALFSHSLPPFSA